MIRPKIFNVERSSLKANIPTKAVPAVPSPAQTLYAILSGICFNVMISNVNEIPNPIIRAMVGVILVKPLESLSIDVEKISNSIDVNNKI